MQSIVGSIALIISLSICTLAFGDEAQMQKRLADLEARVAELEFRLDEVSAKDRWKDPILWKRVKQEMSTDEIRKLLGKPARVEEQIFTTWYYHPTSKLHSFVWFDEGKVLGFQHPN